MRILSRQNAAVTPVDQGIALDHKNSTLLSSSIEPDVQISESLMSERSSGSFQSSLFSFFTFKSLRSNCGKVQTNLLTETRKSSRLADTSGANHLDGSFNFDDPFFKTDENYADLKRAFELTRCELAASIERERQNSNLQNQKSELERMLSDAISSSKASQRTSDELAVKLINQTMTTASLESLVSSTRAEIELIRNISANTAHDLKSPLHILVIGIESLRRIESLSTHQDTFDCMDSACAFMQSAITRTVDYSLTSGGVGLIPSRSCFNLFTALSSPCKWMRTTVPSDGRIKIILDALPEEMENIISDQHWVEENLLCLLSNAVKYSNRGAIHVSASLNGNNVRVAVEDMGIGISPESKEKLFKQFSKLQNMATGSTGLGLYSLLSRCIAINGACGVTDRADGAQGSVFWFEFPHLVSKEPLAAGPLSRRPSLRGHPRGHLTILLVDDSTIVVKLLSKTLILMGHEVVTAHNGADGLEKMIEMKNQIDLVIMDLQMPVMDGIEATLRYRKLEALDPSRNRLTIICSSANSHSETEALAMSAGVDSFLPKPFNNAKFCALIADIQNTDGRW